MKRVLLFLWKLSRIFWKDWIKVSGKKFVVEFDVGINYNRLEGKV